MKVETTKDMWRRYGVYNHGVQYATCFTAVQLHVGSSFVTLTELGWMGQDPWTPAGVCICPLWLAGVPALWRTPHSNG